MSEDERDKCSIRADIVRRKIGIKSKQSEAAKKAWVTIREKKAKEDYGLQMHRRRSERAKKAWETRLRDVDAYDGDWEEGRV